MKRLLTVTALLGLSTRPAAAHRLDEYLQATILSIEPGSVHATLRMVPGVAVASGIIASIDTNHDGALSQDEQHSYALLVLADLKLSEDGRVLELHLTSATFPSVESMKLGTGEIELGFAADLSPSHGQHELMLQNHHRDSISVYLVNSLVPQDKHLQLTRQVRNRTQSTYEVTIEDAGSAALQRPTWSGFSGAYRLGLRHIAEGTDHLLFLLTLLLPAPLLALAGRWREQASVRRTLGQILRTVTAFTVGHSFTLALSVFGLVQVPSRPVEILIAVSILVSAMHALRPLFPGQEALMAGAFGLVHGLAFASALNELGVSGWYRLISLAGFNLGIETMQLAVVSVTLPALVLLRLTRWYAAVRTTGALFAVVASIAWIVERVRNMPNVIATGVQRFAHHGALLACVLWVFSLSAWFFQDQDNALEAWPEHGLLGTQLGPNKNGKKW